LLLLLLILFYASDNYRTCFFSLILITYSYMTTSIQNLSQLSPASTFIFTFHTCFFFSLSVSYCMFYVGPNDAPLAPTPFEAFVKVPSFLRPHNQIYCTRYCFILIVSVSRVTYILFLSCNFRVFIVLFAASASLYIFGDFLTWINY
jgi:hypothetical protein